jgi:hypothetical protein
VFPTLGFLVIFVAQQGDHYFRFHGFIMVTVSLLGTLGIVAAVDRLPASSERLHGIVTRQRLWSALCVAFVVLLAVQLVVVHPSPYIYQSNSQVPETVMDGYEVSFRHADGTTSFTGVRSGPSRYVDAAYGTQTAGTLDFPGYESDVPEEIFNQNVTSHYENDRYLVLTARDRLQEVELYDGFRYGAGGFEALESERGANRIQDNGGFTLYRLRGTDD